jgi:uncharacterized membrane-anchored protein YhcB (DUF1043 family)
VITSSIEMLVGLFLGIVLAMIIKESPTPKFNKKKGTQNEMPKEEK